MTFGVVTASDIIGLGLNDVVIQCKRIDGELEGTIETKVLRDRAYRVDQMTRDRKMFLSKRSEPFRKLLRKCFEEAGVRVTTEAHLYDLSRRWMKNIRGASHVRGELRKVARVVCDEMDTIARSLKALQYFPS